MTKSIVKTLECKTVFDPCIGWGGRMIGTTCLGEGYHYTGCEPFTKTFNGLEGMVNDLDIGDQDCETPGILNLHNPEEKILPTKGMIVLISAIKRHSVSYQGNTKRIMVGVNFYGL